MDNLDELTNDALRLRLLEYGFANMPVTTTTRNVLIRKLRNAVETTKSKTRRETVNVAKYSSGDDSESDSDKKKPVKKAEAVNRRATIAAPAIPAKKDVRVIVKPIRRSGRTTPSAVNAPALSLVENSDDEIGTILAPPATAAAAAAALPVQLPPVNNRTSRSPSLGKSGVVTTSYKQVIQAVAEEDDEEEDDLVILDESGENDDSSYSEEVSNYTSPKFNYPVKPTVSSIKQTSVSTTTTKTSRTGLGGGYIGHNLDHLRRLTVGGGGGGAGVSNDLRSSSPKVSSLFGNYDAAASPFTNSTAYKRRYTTNAAAISSTTTPHNGSGDDDDLLQKHDTPFLSSFTRRLAELRAEPLPGAKIVPTVSSPSVTSYRTSDYYRTYGDGKSGGSNLVQRGPRSESIAATFAALLRACEQRIRLPLLILLVVLVAVFVYVILFHN